MKPRIQFTTILLTALIAGGFAFSVVAFTGGGYSPRQVADTPPRTIPPEGFRSVNILAYALVVLLLFEAAWQLPKLLGRISNHDASPGTTMSRKVIWLFGMGGFLFGSVALYYLSELTYGIQPWRSILGIMATPGRTLAYAIMTGGEYLKLSIVMALINGVIYAILLADLLRGRCRLILLILAAVMIVSLIFPKQYIYREGFTTKEAGQRWRKSCYGVSIIQYRSPYIIDVPTMGKCYGLIY